MAEMEAKERRLIYANDFLDLFYVASTGQDKAFIKTVEMVVEDTPTVEAVEMDDMKSFAKDVVYQFGYYCQNKGRLHITHGGLSTLEWAFDILGWGNPHPVPECECEIDGCHEHATCGTPTKDGYKRVCGKHFSELQEACPHPCGVACWEQYLKYRHCRDEMEAKEE